MAGDVLQKIYDRLYRRFGPQYWWPGQTPFEVMVGAILTQNTNWGNVEKAIAALRKEKALTCKAIAGMDRKTLASLIRPAGYYNIKAARLKNYVGFFCREFNGSVRRMAREEKASLRERLLAVNGVGRETADSILLYALEKPVFVVDAYTKRIFSRHGIIAEDADYEAVRAVFTTGLRQDTRLYNEYHALIVRLGKEYCLKREPRCESCPLKELK